MKKLITSVAILFTVVFTSNALADPLSEFKKIVNKCSSGFDKKQTSKVFFLPKLSKWNKKEIDASQINFDVTKTDSLVSPYTGKITVFESNRWGVPVESETDASSIAIDENSSATKSETTITYAYQDAKWILKTAKSNVKMKLPNKTSFGEPLSFEITEFQNMQMPLKNCFIQ